MRISRHVDVSKTVFHVAFVAMAVSVAQVTTEDCGQEELVQCTKPLQVLSATSELSFVTKKEELDKLCPDLHAGLHCIRSYTRRCMNIHQREHFNKLYHGTHEVIHELCQEGPYQEDFLRHAPCMRHVKKDYEVCAVSYQSTMAKIGQTVAHSTVRPPVQLTTPSAAMSLSADNVQHQHHHHRQQHQHSSSNGSNNNDTKTAEDAEEERLKTVCCAFHKYMQCSEFTVRHACGDETALFTRKFLDKMSNKLMTMHCVDYTPGSGKCRDYFSSHSTRVQHRGILTWMVTLTGLLLALTSRLVNSSALI
ncbi:uncharacterized protein LOC5568971 [Aedes aegypti]|uniref:Uncharacterized protein n=2 Tax=Aedes aegypti TaxID=7159 RepID=A0A1S4G717_AEDAE|nr:uncharacterized protein LOC5568971 [Aedes aegypti]XP_021709707.1 uncharacterized protein LOC5568971 [Aedes aegypti]XP_021709708.1 uncharacterized protein LOC5568971 [Aedes aegypti]XP_021709709.1 uncharacterized protein LOC5568971 [Aedes aegypti]XP_021709710.1 uncharacterized protein LOC5568971 [Aedes aegypti]XP_021709711.1 uncharacterized protein LOC5568971 [Aedes aegypti]